MAWRIEESVVRGEIDNRIKGMVRGKVWIEGRADPLELELKGNACSDLAGCLLTFWNPKQPVARPDFESLKTIQRGSVGDLTSSRKVRVFDVPVDAALAMIRNGEKPPEHLGNCLYIEWFSEVNGRVVIESTDYELRISEPAWRLSSAEEQERAAQANGAMDRFLGRLTESIEKHKGAQKDPGAEWDEHDYEKLLRESDARGEKYQELLEKYGDNEELIAEIMGWTRQQDEAGEAFLSEEEIDEINNGDEWDEPAPDPETEGIDWIRLEGGHVVHPLQHRCSEAAMKYWRAAGEVFGERIDDEDVEQFLVEFQITGAKLAGALNGVAGGEAAGIDDAFIVACLKRALNHLHRAQAGLEKAKERNQLSADITNGAREDLFAIREGILALMDRFRGRGEGKDEG